MNPRYELTLFLSALGFLTRLPVPAFVGWSPGRLARASRYFVLAGALAALPAAIVFWIAGLVLPDLLAAGLALLSLIWVTGALHEDGLADCADGLGVRGRERTLEVMRDSRIGAFGVLALIFSVGLRWATLAALGVCAGAFALVLAGGIGRAVIGPATAFLHYARPEGAGTDIAEGARLPDIAIGLASALVLALVGGWAGLLALILGCAAAALVVALMERRIGGYTGDVLGAPAQVGEVTVLIVLAAAWHAP